MVTLEQIIALAGAGFTKDDILALSGALQGTPTPTVTQTPTPTPTPTPIATPTPTPTQTPVPQMMNVPSFLPTPVVPQVVQSVPAQTPTNDDKLIGSIQKLTQAVQSYGLLQPMPTQATPEENVNNMLASIINPTGSGNGGNK
jgi:hypothetical protein|nr:MAG TPA: PR-1 protein fever, LIPID BINDING PROTEIN [Caudoviricetes sp.]